MNSRRGSLIDKHRVQRRVIKGSTDLIENKHTPRAEGKGGGGPRSWRGGHRELAGGTFLWSCPPLPTARTLRLLELAQTRDPSACAMARNARSLPTV
jgi:hypothetical protein